MSLYFLVNGFVVFDEIHSFICQVRHDTLHRAENAFDGMETIINTDINLITFQDCAKIFDVVLKLIELMEFRLVTLECPKQF